MSIKKDAGNLLLHIYLSKIKGERFSLTEMIKIDDLKKQTEWDDVRFYNAIEYLDNKQFIKTNNYYGSITQGSERIGPSNNKTSDFKNDFKWMIHNITDKGIDIVERVEKEDSKFNIIFNFNFKWESLIKGEMKLF